MTRWIALAGLALGAAGCSSPRSAFPCSSSTQCVAGGQQGTCSDGFCAFPDPECPGGMRWEGNAGGGHGGACVPEPPDASGPCGAAGQACCSFEGAACQDHLACSSGTCAPCITDLAFGRRFSCVLHGRAVSCSGANTKGQLGVGIMGAASAVRGQARDPTGPILDAVSISAGREHACAVRAGGTVWCWGANESGQLGNNAAVTVPPAPPTPPQPAAVAVAKATGTPLADILEVGAGYDFTCARDATGGVWCWGNNGKGSLGDGTTTTRSAAAPVLDAPGGAPLTGALALQVGGGVACVRKTGDAMWCWGHNGNGQFGDTTTANHTSPVLLATTRSLALGNWHTCALETDSTISCAGWNGHARLGIGTGAGYSGGNQLTKVKVLAAVGGTPFTGAAAVVAGGVSCALLQDTSVVCWGDDQYGQSGTGQGEVVPTPVRTADGKPLTGVERLVAGFTHVCAFKATGEVLCWGRNSEGDLGDAAFSNHGFPAPIENTCR